MKDILKKNEGITIVALAVIIAVILMISGVAIYQGIASYRESKKVAFIAELEIIQRKVNEISAASRTSTEGTVEEQIPDPDPQEYSCTKDVQTYIIPKTGTYKLEVWGAQGGTAVNSTTQLNYGGYATGEVNLVKRRNNIYLCRRSWK